MMKSLLVFILLLVLFAGKLFGQAPNISYATPQVYTHGVAISPLTPTNTGGAVPPVTLTGTYTDPRGVAVDASGNVYVADDGTNSVKEIPIGGGSVITLGSGFNHPLGVAVDASGNVYVTDSNNNAIKMIPAGNGTVVTVASAINQPYGIALDGHGYMYVTEFAGNDALKIPVGGGTPVVIGTGFNSPTGIAVDASGNVYVADRGNNAIKEIKASDGSIVTLVSANGNPGGVAVDAAGNVYFADTNNTAVEEIPAGGSSASVIGAVVQPSCVALDSYGDIYAGDANAKQVKEVGPLKGYTISPALPTGLTFNTATGVITGTPGSTSPATNYTVTAGNAAGSGTAIVNITVNNPPVPAISYATPQVYTAGVQITTLTPANSGGAVQASNGYAISPALPSGLSFNVNTGAISGTPTAVTAATDYTVTATNLGGSGTTKINITVNPSAPPNISYHTPNSYNVGASVDLLPTNTGGAISAAKLTVYTNGGDADPTDLVIDASGNKFVCSDGLQEIYAGGGTRGFTGSVGIIRGVAVDPSGNIYVADDSTVGMYPANGGPRVTLATGIQTGYGIALDGRGYVYVSEQKGNDVLKLPVGGGPTVVAAAGLSKPMGMVADANGNIYVIDRGHNLLKKIQILDGSVITVPTTSFAPNALTIDAANNLYFSDYVKSLIGEIPAGGGGGITYTKISVHPNCLAIDPNGNIFISVGSTWGIEELQINGYNVSPSLPLGLTMNTASGEIMGTLTQATPATNYTVTATGTGGTGSTVVNIGTANPNVNDAALAGLTLSSGTLSPAFAPGTLNYTALVQNTVSSIKLTPTADSIPVTIQVNGTTVASGSASAAISLPVGKTTITVLIKAPDGATKTYTVTVQRLKSAVDVLSGLSLSSGALSPGFNANTTSYTSSVVNSVSSVTVTPTAGQANETIAVNGTATVSGHSSAPIPLNIGNNTVSVVVTSQSGLNTNTYTITVTRASSSDALLSGLSISSGTLTPAFASSTTSYTATVPNSVSSITLTPTADNSSATIKINGTTVASGSASAAIPLAVGANTVTTVVKASDNTTTKTYTVTITRNAATNDATLYNLAVSSGTLSPTFASGTLNYSDLVQNPVASITVTPTSNTATDNITVNGTAVTSGAASAAIPLTVGNNTVSVVVTGSGGSPTKTYTLTVQRLKSAVDTLNNIQLSAGTLSPGFYTLTTGYTATVGNPISGITVTPTAGQANETITVNGTTTASGTASASIPLSVGSNTITIVATSQNGLNSKTYTVTVTRNTPSNATLSNLAISSGTLSPAFASNTLSYSDLVQNPVSSITVTPTATQSTDDIKVNGTAVTSGTASAAIPLAVGNNTISVVVTEQGGTTTKTYNLTVQRLKSAVDTLNNIQLSSGTLSPSFYTLTTSYNANVSNATSSITVTPTAGQADETITVNGTTTPSGTASAPIALSVGANTITIAATSQNGLNTKTYTVTVNRSSGGADAFVDNISVSKPNETVTIADDGIKVHEGVTPNGDGINDFLTIDNISQYPDNKLSVMNRNGQLIFEAKGYDNTSKVFDGRSNKTGQMQQPGTYFYQLDYTVDGVVKHKTGFIVLKY